MKRQDVLSILITFVVGFFAGGYLYTTHFSKLVSPDSVQSRDEISEFSIVSKTYGGCRDLCSAFQISADGSYRYQFTREAGGEKEILTGVIPRNVLQDIKQRLDVDELVAQSQPINPVRCNSYGDGIDVSYTIAFEGAEYTLDSCGTAVDGDSELWKSLLIAWNYLQTLQ
jgi:hypothetical protein